MKPELTNPIVCATPKNNKLLFFWSGKDYVTLAFMKKSHFYQLCFTSFVLLTDNFAAISW